MAAASLLIPASSSTSTPPLDETHQLTQDWKASFYYLQSLTSSDVHDHAGEDADFLMDHQPSFHELNTALRHYRETADGIVRQLSIAHEVALRSEQLLFPNHDPRICEGENTRTKSPSFLSCKLEQKISNSARLLEQNIIVLEKLLKPFPINVGLSPLHHAPDYSNPTNSPLSNSHFTFPPSDEDLDHRPTEPDLPIQSLSKYIPTYKPSHSNANEFDGEEEPYNSASHIITHMARDWTAVGVSIRNDTYDWIVDQLLSYHDVQFNGHSQPQLDSTCSQQSPLSPVLVPGAGMARLAFDIAFAARNQNDNDGTKHCYPFVVEAVDNSIVMATAAYHLLHHPDFLKIYPIAADPFINEVDTHWRWDSAVFPEEDVVDQLRRLRVQQTSHQPSLSYVIGDFVSVYASPSKHGMYGSIATCFFIDTSTNIYEYILTIRNLLRTGGVWINLGPVQWHSNAQLQPSTNELKDLISLAGFEIKHWEITEKLLAYRHPDDIKRGTRAEAYRPLKFVAVLQPDRDEAQTDGNLLSSMEKLRQVTGRRSGII